MTAQAGDTLIFEGESYTIASEPLYDYLEQKGIEFISMSTACWRGYLATWEIKKDKLFLTELEAYVGNYSKVELSYLFPGKKEVFAEWFSGEIIVQHGKMLQYFHAGYESIYEKEMYLIFENGVLSDRREAYNSEELL